jgi:hypothetical protein
LSIECVSMWIPVDASVMWGINSGVKLLRASADHTNLILKQTNQIGPVF